ncbi:DUF3806 domain-containing protein [Chromatocurvus halotolerans]|uniref:Uncharacterized protein DUF3806 n=1 Tax=Chromatocurvus halotolerans TaxID=1132028 RepID=A0A4R2KX97_9GAMM|nr:DUF3806 domain-containing protein [Chromatocurvus halotolerans]TCO75939.1 uncharacterized protein DUF3806 [Chromatocurvus halotolerans]
MNVLTRLCLVIIATLLFSSLPAAGQDQLRISELTPLDRQYMQRQRDAIESLARRHTGSGFDGSPANDIPLLQRLLDERRVRPEQTEELQAMGILLGDVLARELDMHWVIYEDPVGRSRALRYRETDNYLFPATMISRRRAVGNDRPVQEIYDKAIDLIEPIREKRPFQ